MGITTENYTRCSIRGFVYLIISALTYVSAAAQDHCPVRVDIEPTVMTQVRSANKYEQIPFPIFEVWDTPNAMSASDDGYTTLTLDGYRRSTILKASNMGFNIPEGAQIHGIELFFEGHSTGSGIIDDLSVKLIDGQGNNIGNNQANQALPTDRYYESTADSTDIIWRYGKDTDIWGATFNNTILNVADFGFELQIRNRLADEINVNLDQVSMIVYYTPLYTICDEHPCVPFYVFDDYPNLTYEWFLPQGFELISDSEHDPMINIKASYAEFGTYEICCEAYENNIPQGQCCRKFNYQVCATGSIGDQVFLDKNGNSIFDTADEVLSGIVINLFASDSTYVSSTSSNS